MSEKKETLKKNAAAWWEPTPDTLEYTYDTNMHESDRKKLQDESEKEKSTHKGLKKFLINHGVGTGALTGALAGGLAGRGMSSSTDKGKGGLYGAMAGGVIGGLLGTIPTHGPATRIEENFLKNNPSYLKRHYEDPRRLDRQLKKEEINAIRERNWSNRYD